MSDQWQSSSWRDRRPIAEYQADSTDPYIGPNTSAQLVAIGRLEGIAGAQHAEQPVRQRQMQERMPSEEFRRASLSVARRLMGQRRERVDLAGDEPLAPVCARGHRGTSLTGSTRALPNVSAVIACRDNERTIRAVVDSLLNQNYAKLVEIILVGSRRDSTWESLKGIYDRRLMIREVASPPGTSDTDFKWDFGLRMSSCGIVYLGDPNMVLRRDWLSRGVAALDESRRDGRIAPISASHDFMPRFVDLRRSSVRTLGLTDPPHGDGAPRNFVNPDVRTSTRSDFTGSAEQFPPTGVNNTGVDGARKPRVYDADRYEMRATGAPGDGWVPKGDPIPGMQHRIEYGRAVPAKYEHATHLTSAGPNGGRDYNRDARYKRHGVAPTPTPTPRRAYEGASRYVTPPTEEEKYSYIRGGQKRWFILAQYAAFLSVIISFAGFTLSSYETFIFSIPLVLFATEQTLSLYTSSRRRRINLASHQKFVGAWAPRRYPSVDVFVPTAGEDLNLLDNTIRHMSLLEWPGELRVFVLDDSARIAVRHLAEKYGLGYLARPGSEYKKAGNLRYAAERTNGEIIVIFDADFVPRHDFLVELVPYMDDPCVGIVQSPQFFDTTKEMNWVQRCACFTQELFYRFIQPSRDALGAAVCVGTSALYRRAALDAVGGFPLLGQSEDIYTGLYMSDAGYSIRYVPVILSKGLTPDNLDNFISQQYRWCEGSMTMLVTRRFHTTPCLPLRARLCFWSGFLYYISTAISALIIPLPTIIMTWLFPEWVRSWNTIWLIGALATWLVGYPLIMRSRWRVEVLRIQTVYGFAHLFNIVDLIRNRVVEWHPTGSKAPAPIAVRVKRFYALYLGVTLSTAAAGLVLRIAEDGLATFAGMLLFFLINLYVAGPLVASAMVSELRARRRRKIAEADVDARMLSTA